MTIRYPTDAREPTDADAPFVMAGGANDSGVACQGPHYADVRTLLRDTVVTDLYQGIAPITIAPQRPVRLCLNADFWGIYFLRERVDENLVRDRTGATDIDIVGNLDEARVGDLTAWNEMTAHFASGRFDTPEALAEAGNSVDLDWLATYALVNSWASNHDKRWDYDGITQMRQLTPFGTLADESPEYRTRIAQLWCVLRNGALRPDNVHAVIDAKAATLRDDIPLETARWGSTPEAWEANVTRIHDMPIRVCKVKDRRASSPLPAPGRGWREAPGEGTMRVETLDIRANPWTGAWFMNLDATLTPVPAEGWAFACWSGAASGADASLVVHPTGDLSVTATFVAL